MSHPSDPNNPNKFRKLGGGVLIAIRSNIQADIKRLSVRKGAEIVAIEVTIDNKKFVFCTVYRVGNLDEPNHASIINTIKTFYTVRNPRKIFILGDFNLRCISWPLSDESELSSGTEKLFADSFQELGLDQCITEPTHNKGRILDLLLTNSKNIASDIKVISDKDLCKSDHYLITLEIKTNVKHKKVPKRKILNFKKANWVALNYDLGNIRWNTILDCMEPELAWLAFKHTLFSLTKRHIPSISVKSDFTSPWFDSDCFEAYRKKERSHKKFKSKSNLGDNTQDILQSEIKFKQKRQDFKNICNMKMRENLYNEDDPDLITKKFWSHIKSNSKSCRLPETMHLNSTFRNKPSEKAELFNNYFYDQFSGPSDYNINIGWSNDQVFDIDLDQNKVRKLLLNINSNKASGPDGIHGKILKNCANTLAYPLSLLFKISYNTGSLPKEWKIANVVPIHKKGSKDDIKNYRPISLTSLVMKTFERILKDELLIRTSHLLDCRQHGFLNFKSCTTNMVNFTDKLVMSINDTQTLSTDVIYFDFSKAFDSVNHDLILHKLKYEYAIDGSLLKFLMNYLGEREQSVVLDGIKSSSKPVLSGVPQGSILGPILFVLFINDLPQGISEDTHLALYADDTKIWRSIRNEEDIVQLQKDINNLHMWSINNKMMFHPDKCKVVTIKHKPSPLAMLPFVAYHYHLAENLLSYADSERDLGVHVNKSFNFNEHCEKLLIKANQQFGILKRTCHFVTNKNRRRVLYLALVRSQFEHCSPIWRPCGNTMINKFENFQKKCIKWILSELELSYSNEVYLRKCKQVNILPLLYRFMFNDMNLFHKVVYKIIPVTMPDYLTLYSGDSRLRSTHLDNLCFVSNIASTTTSISNLNKSFFFRSHTLWNFLPFDLRNSMIPSQFKIKLAKHYWNMASTEIEQPEDEWFFQSSDVGD